MKTTRSFSLSLLVAALVATGSFVAPWSASTAFAQEKAPAATDVLRPAIFKLAKSAQDLVAEKKYAEAMTLVKEIDAIADKTPFEAYFNESIRSTIMQATNDNPGTIKSFEALLATGRLDAGAQVKMIHQLGVRYYQLKDYPHAITYLSRTLTEAGDDRKVRVLLIQAYYLNNEYARTATELRTLIASDEKAGQRPDLDLLQLFASAVVKSEDKAGYIEALEKFVLYYPKKDYWRDLIQKIEAKPGFPERLQIDVYRLLYNTGSMESAVEYTDMASLAMAAGFPAEAKQVLDQAYAGTLMAAGSANEVKARQKLRDQVNKAAADDLKTMANGEADASKPGKDGNALTNLGYAFVLTGQFDRGLELMNRGVAKGLGKRTEDGKLHLGVAYHLAGRKADAVKTLATVGGTEGTAELARYWTLLINSVPPAAK